MIFEIRMDKESSRGIGMRLLAPKSKQSQSYLFWLPRTSTGPAKVAVGNSSLGKNTAVRRSCPSPLSLWIRQPDKRVCDQRRKSGCGSRWLLAGAGLLPLLQVVSMVYVLLWAEVFFPVLTLYSPRSIVWGLFFFSSLSSCYAVFFFNSTCISLLIILVWLCMWRIIKNLEPWTLH